MYQLVWRGTIHDSQGYARAGREYLLALDRLGVDIKIEPINYGTPPVRLIPEQAKRIKELIQKPYAVNKKKVLLYHAQPYGINPIEERRKGYDKVFIKTAWETTVVPDNWFPSINHADAVFVPSKQNIQALEDSGVNVPIFLVPHGADVDTFNPDNKPLSIPEVEETFNFLSVFQWQNRKAPEILLSAYLEEFSSKDNVALIIKSYWGNSGIKEDQRAVKRSIENFKSELGVGSDSAPIYYTGSIFSENDIRGLYNTSDVFVLPSRGEGVGLPYLEAMSSGLPCIATGWGGQTDFINNSNGYLIDYKMVSTMFNEGNSLAPHFSSLFNKSMQWANPDVSHLRELMRYTYENQEEVKSKGFIARLDMETMTWCSVGETLKESIEKVIG